MKNTDRSEKNKNIRITDRIAVYVSCAFLLCFLIGFFAVPKKEFSESENRMLSKAPEFSFDNIISGSFTGEMGTYVADHFPMRDEFLCVFTETERLSGRKEIEGVYLAKDGSLIEAYDAPVNTQKQIEQFGKLTENVTNAECYLMLVPTAVSVYSDKLPEYAPDLRTQAQNDVIEEVNNDVTQNDVIEYIYSEVPDDLNTINVSGKLINSSEKDPDHRLFYRTDHHWTTYGAYIGYEAFCEAAGLLPVPLSSYDSSTVSEDFRGTIYSKLNDPYFGTDTIISYSHPDWNLTVEYSDTGEMTDTPYNPEYLSRKDQYSYFLNNIHPLVTVTNDSVKDGAIAVVKDSYANCFVPYLFAHYHTVYIFDTRYYKGGPSKFINEHPDITDVLILYNMNTIDNDAGIGGVY